MKIPKLLSAASIMLASMATGCVDNNYDFSDIDTTTRVNVTDLTVPVNIDAIQLKTIIDIDENDPNNHIKIIDGEYAYVQDGDFTSGNITVAPVTVKAVNNSTIDFSIPVNVPTIPGGVAGVKLPDIPVSVPAQYAGYDFKAQNISDDICNLSKVIGDLTVSVKVTLSGVEGLAAGYDFNDFKLQLPEYLIVKSVEGATYDNSTNTLSITKSLSSASFEIKCNASGLNIPKGTFDENSHTINISGEVGILGGDITIHPRDNIDLSNVGDLKLKVDYAFSSMAVTSVDGEIKYDITGVNIPDIDIKDLPDILAQPGTNLILNNPCLYLSVNNPLHVIGAYAQTGFEITSFHGAESVKYSIDKPYFTIEANEIDNFCFSPKMPTSSNGLANLVHVPFSGLSYVLSGNGLPDKLSVSLINPGMPRQHISNFMLDHDYGKVHGTYTFVAPLQFKEGTQITYSDKIDGWSSDDLDKMTITRLDVNFTISTDVPFAVDFTGYPIDKKGNRINNVEIIGANIDANANKQQVKISITGSITDLDGIEFVAKASTSGNGNALSPDMNITLSDIRPCVSGYYQTEL